MKTFATQKFKTSVATLAFAQGLFTPKAIVEGGPLKYGCTLIYPVTALQQFQDAIKEVIVGAYGDKGFDKWKSGRIKNPILKGDGPQAHNRAGELYAGFGPDKFFLRVQSGEKQPPVIRARELGEQTPADEMVVYSGCQGWAVLHAFNWDHPTGGEGISFGIDMFCKTADGERLGGGGPVDPTKWWDDEDKAGTASGTSSTKGNGNAASNLFD